MEKVTSADMSNEAFPFMTWADIDVDYWIVKAFRVTFVGELGWELYVPTEFAVGAFDALWDVVHDDLGTAAAVAIALDEAQRSGRIKRGDHILMVVFGGGLTWASSVVRW